MKYIITILLLFFIGCASERGYRERERDRILNLTDEEVVREKESCIAFYQHLINVTQYEEKKCYFFRGCINGKKQWRERLYSCFNRIDNIRKRGPNSQWRID